MDCQITSQFFTTQPDYIENYESKITKAEELVNRAFQNIGNLAKMVELVPLPKNEKKKKN